MENRIRRLAFEQERANKLTEIATKKAESLLEARERHQKQLEEKIRMQELRRQQEEAQRLKNQQTRQASVARRDAHIEIKYRQKVHARYQAEHHEKMGYRRRVLDKQADASQRRTSQENVFQQKQDFHRKRVQTLQEQELMLAREYKEKGDHRV